MKRLSKAKHTVFFKVAIMDKLIIKTLLICESCEIPVQTFLFSFSLLVPLKPKWFIIATIFIQECSGISYGVPD